MEVLFDTLLITQDSESVLFYAVAGLYNLSNDASFAQMAARKPGVLAKLHSLNESANPDTVKYATGTVDNWVRQLVSIHRPLGRRTPAALPHCLTCSP